MLQTPNTASGAVLPQFEESRRNRTRSFFPSCSSGRPIAFLNWQPAVVRLSRTSTSPNLTNFLFLVSCFQISGRIAAVLRTVQGAKEAC